MDSGAGCGAIGRGTSDDNENHYRYASGSGGWAGPRIRPSVPVVAGPDRAVLHLDREAHRRRVGRRIERAAVADVELRSMQHAFDGRFLAIEAEIGRAHV